MGVWSTSSTRSTASYPASPVQPASAGVWPAAAASRPARVVRWATAACTLASSTSRARVDLPEPLTPVTATSLPSYVSPGANTFFSYKTNVNAVGNVVPVANGERVTLRAWLDRAEAWRILQDETAPRIAILDWMMPGMDGFATCAALRKLPGGAAVPILIMTGLDDVKSIATAYDAGATDFVTKPWNALVLSHRVRYMLRASQAVQDLLEREMSLAEAQRIARLGNWRWALATNRFIASTETYRILGIKTDPATKTDRKSVV